MVSWDPGSVCSHPGHPPLPPSTASRSWRLREALGDLKMLTHAPCFPKVEMGLVWAVARPSGVFRVPQVSVASSPQPTETDPSGCCRPPWTHWAPIDTGSPHMKACGRLLLTASWNPGEWSSTGNLGIDIWWAGRWVSPRHGVRILSPVYTARCSVVLGRWRPLRGGWLRLGSSTHPAGTRVLAGGL